MSRILKLAARVDVLREKVQDATKEIVKQREEAGKLDEMLASMNGSLVGGYLDTYRATFEKLLEGGVTTAMEIEMKRTLEGIREIVRRLSPLSSMFDFGAFETEIRRTRAGGGAGAPGTTTTSRTTTGGGSSSGSGGLGIGGSAALGRFL